MASTASMSMEEILACFENLKDPRSTINRVHPLVSVVVITIMGSLAGADGPTAIARWAKRQEDFLKEFLDLPHGVPCKDVFRRVLTGLKPEAYQACFTAWLQVLRVGAAEASGVEQPVLSVDGKTSRRSHDRQNDLNALHAVSVWANEFGLSLGQLACDADSNEIPAIPKLLDLVDVAGSIITIDAIGAQKEIAEKVVARGADYVLALKGNQKTLHDEVRRYVEEQVEQDFADGAARQLITSDRGHGREETRYFTHLPVPKSFPGREEWKGFQSIGVVVTECVRDGQETIDRRYYISSLKVGVKRFARAARGHWGIENRCHWTLDVTFGDDDSRIQNQNMRDNFAWLRRFSLSLLMQHPGRDSIAMKRRLCGWDVKYLLEVLTGGRS